MDSFIIKFNFKLFVESKIYSLFFGLSLLLLYLEGFGPSFGRLFLGLLGLLSNLPILGVNQRLPWVSFPKIWPFLINLVLFGRTILGPLLAIKGQRNWLSQKPFKKGFTLFNLLFGFNPFHWTWFFFVPSCGHWIAIGRVPVPTFSQLLLVNPSKFSGV